MRDEDQGFVLYKLSDEAGAFLHEVEISDGEGFVYDEDFGVEMDADGEGEPDRHAAAVGLERLVDELLKFGKVDDLLELFVYDLAAESEDGGVEVDVLPARKLEIETGAQFQEGSHSSIGGRGTSSRLERAGEDL